MTGKISQKRRREGVKRQSTAPTPRKRIKKQREYHSSSEDGLGDDTSRDFEAVDFLESDEDDIHDVVADDGAASAYSQSDTESETDEISDEDSNVGIPDTGLNSLIPKQKSKRNDPTAFSISMNKILGTKLSSTRRADPVLSRSTDAAQAARAAEEHVLEARARRKLREQKKQAKERGRIRDVMVGAINEKTGEPIMAVSEILADEKRLKKIATRGVVRMFNAIRQAQVGAAEAERFNRNEGVIGHTTKKENITDMSKEAFLDLIAKGGGGLSKKPLEEA